MRKAKVFRNGHLLGMLIETDQRKYIFRYNDDYFQDDGKPAVSLTMPKNKKEYQSDHLFPFFFNMLSEGVNRKLQSRRLKIDERDSFGLLLETAQFDTIGAINIVPDED